MALNLIIYLILNIHVIAGQYMHRPQVHPK